MTRVALYARVSTKEQDDYGTSLDTQVKAMERFIRDNGLTMVGVWREDFTGTKHDRPAINEIKQLARANGIDAILCYSRDRYARSRIAGLMLDMHFKETNVERLYVMREKSQDTPQGMMRDGFDDLMHEYEVSLLRERSMRGKRELQQRGVYLATGNVIYGYRRIEGRKEDIRIAIDTEPKHDIRGLESESAVVAFVFDQYLRHGLGVIEVVDKLNAYGIPSPGSQRLGFNRLQDATWRPWTLYRILGRAEYTGTFTAHKYKVLPNGKKVKTTKDEQVTIELPELAIIDKNTFVLTQEKLRAGRRNKQPKFEYLMGKRVKDMNGHNMLCNTLPNRSGSKRSYYVCFRPAKYSRKVCDMPMFRVDKVDPIVWRFVVDLIQDPDAQIEGFKRIQEQSRSEHKDKQATVEELDKLIDKQQSELSYLMEEAKEFRDNPRVREHYREKIAECSKRIELLEQEKRTLSMQIDQVIISDEEIESRRAFIESIRATVKDLNELTFAQRRRLIELLNIRIVLGVESTDRKYVDVYWYSERARKHLDDSQDSQPSRRWPGSRAALCS